MGWRGLLDAAQQGGIVWKRAQLHKWDEGVGQGQGAAQNCRQ